MEINDMYDINYRACITILTTIMKNPRQQKTSVSQTTCINAKNERSSSMFSENEMTLLCLSIRIPNEDTEDP